MKRSAVIASLGVAALIAVPASAAGSSTATLSEKHRGDVGMGSDPTVVLYEDFSAGSVAAVVARYNTAQNSAGLALVEDHPPNSPGSQAMKLTAGGSHPATSLYKSFGAGYDELYFRYYIKYVGTGPYHHAGLWIGGYNPPLEYPYPRAGSRPSGTDLYSIGLEPIGDVHLMDLYTYWMQMRSWKEAPTGAQGDYWGNTLLQDAGFRLASNSWECYELHLRLNPDPASGAGAVLEVWNNDVLVRRFDDTGPFGYWVRDKFCPTGSTSFACTTYRPANPKLVQLDQRWRATPALKINYFSAQNYNTDRTDSSLLLADMVVAKVRIACTVRK
jgi:hypothetical protein